MKNNKGQSIHLGGRPKDNDEFNTMPKVKD